RSSLVVLHVALFQLSLQREGVGDRDCFAGGDAAEYLDIVIVLEAGPDRTRLKSFAVAHEDRRRAPDGLKGLPWDNDPGRLAAEWNLRRDKRARLPTMIGVGHAGDDACVAGLAIEQRADEDHLGARFTLDANGADRDWRAFVHRRDVLRGNRQINPNIVKVDD